MRTIEISGCRDECHFQLLDTENDQLSRKWWDHAWGRGHSWELGLRGQAKSKPKAYQFILFLFSIYCYFPFTVSSNIHFQGLDSTLSFFCSLNQWVGVLKEIGTWNQLFGLIRLYSSWRRVILEPSPSSSVVLNTPPPAVAAALSLSIFHRQAQPGNRDGLLQTQD